MPGSHNQVGKLAGIKHEIRQSSIADIMAASNEAANSRVSESLDIKVMNNADQSGQESSRSERAIVLNKLPDMEDDAIV